MNAADGRDGDGREERDAPSARERFVGFLVLEAIAVGIALFAPLTPSKTGGDPWTPARWITPDPGYLEEVAASFVLVQVIFLFLGVLVWLSVKLSGSE